MAHIVQNAFTNHFRRMTQTISHRELLTNRQASLQTNSNRAETGFNDLREFLGRSSSVRLTIGVAPNPVIDIDLIGIGFTTDTP
jgi:hypothetical protein